MPVLRRTEQRNEGEEKSTICESFAYCLCGALLVGIAHAPGVFLIWSGVEAVLEPAACHSPLVDCNQNSSTYFKTLEYCQEQNCVHCIKFFKTGHHNSTYGSVCTTASDYKTEGWVFIALGLAVFLIPTFAFCGIVTGKDISLPCRPIPASKTSQIGKFLFFGALLIGGSMFLYFGWSDLHSSPKCTGHSEIDCAYPGFVSDFFCSPCNSDSAPCYNLEAGGCFRRNLANELWTIYAVLVVGFLCITGGLFGIGWEIWNFIKACIPPSRPFVNLPEEVEVV